MKVLSIDIGIRNLSFCIMEKLNDNFVIHLWENYNLLDAPVEKCKSLTKKGTVCGKVCKFTCKGEWSCKVHLPKNEVFKEIKSKLVDSFTLQEISLIVLKKVTEIYNENTDEFMELDKILIEKQPKIANKMQMVSNLVFGKLTELLEGEKTLIRFVSASKKAILFGDVNSEIVGTLKGNKGYKNRKNASVEYVTKYLQNGKVIDAEFWLNRLKAEGKQNDKTDSGMYCITELMDKSELKNLKMKKIIKKPKK